jgi:hypothetical protein
MVQKVLLLRREGEKFKIHESYLLQALCQSFDCSNSKCGFGNVLAKM